uniref:Uncharacterized protein n=1 Tax=Oryza sativa subsp. japonica TaxID=39947 RepID=Q10IZ6_ORYSJ|nr:hypothetical protein LOC_Os03g32532 [Oryza sativa Japonica Group]
MEVSTTTAFLIHEGLTV